MYKSEHRKGKRVDRRSRAIDLTEARKAKRDAAFNRCIPKDLDGT